MKTIILLVLTMMVVLACAGAPILTLHPGSGVVSGEPGGVAGWGFTMTSDPDDWIAVVASFLLFETNPGIGIYEDFIGLQGGPADGLLAPGAADWTQNFDPLLGTGLGAYYLAPFAPPGSSNLAQLFVFFERFSDNPITCGDCSLGVGELVVPVEINAVASSEAIPEPGTLSLLLVAGALAGLQVNRRRHCGTHS